MDQKVIIIKGVPEIYNTPIAFNGLKYTEEQAVILFEKTIDNAKEINSAIISAFHEKWENNPKIILRVVLGNWLTNSLKHFNASIILTEGVFSSLVTTVHYRQIFENYLQTKYFLSISPDKLETTSKLIHIFGILELIEKLDPVKEQPEIAILINDVKEILNEYDQNFVNEIIKIRKSNNKKPWFQMSFSNLAKEVSDEGENLKGAYQLLSANVHGHWNLLLDVQFPSSGGIDFKGYSNRTQLYLGAAEDLYQTSGTMMKLWNLFAGFVRGKKIFYL